QHHLGIRRQRRVNPFECREHALDEKPDAGVFGMASALGFQRRLEGAAARVAEYHEERRAEMGFGVLQGARDLSGEDVARDAYHEKLTKADIEDQFRRDA